MFSVYLNSPPVTELPVVLLKDPVEVTEPVAAGCMEFEPVYNSPPKGNL